MEPLTDQLHSTIDSENGSNQSQLWSRLDLDYGFQCLVLAQLERVLEMEVRLQNQSIFLNPAFPVEEIDMRSVKDTASSIKDIITKIQQLTTQAQDKFNAESNNAITNAGNLLAAANDLADANKMMEEALGATGSNFPPSEPPSGGSSTQQHTDINGVTLNKGA